MLVRNSRTDVKKSNMPKTGSARGAKEEEVIFRQLGVANTLLNSRAGCSRSMPAWTNVCVGDKFHGNHHLRRKSPSEDFGCSSDNIVELPRNLPRLLPIPFVFVLLLLPSNIINSE